MSLDISNRDGGQEFPIENMYVAVAVGEYVDALVLFVSGVLLEGVRGTRRLAFLETKYTCCMCGDLLQTGGVE